MIRVLAVILITCIISCNNKNKIPDEVIKPEKMEAVLWDMIRADQLSQETFLKDTARRLETENLSLYKKVFQVHKISNQNFKSSLAFYQRRPDLLRAIFDSIHSKQSRVNEKQQLPVEPVKKIQKID